MQAEPQAIERVCAIVLSLANVVTVAEACQWLGIGRAYFQELRQRFLEVVLAAFASQPPGRRASVLTPELAELAVLRRQKQELEAEIVRLRVQLEMAPVTQRRGAVAPQKSRQAAGGAGGAARS